MMSDPFEVLRTPDRRVEPDVEFRRRVMLDVDVAIDSHGAMTAVDERQEMTLEETDSTHTTGHGRLWPLIVVLAAAAVAIVALAAAVVLRDRDASEPAVIQQPSTTVAADSGIAFDAGIAAEMARQLLIDPAAEYAPGWTAAPVQPMTLDRSVAAKVPGCAPFLDTVFESTGRPARVDYRFFHLDESIASQYVVVFPSETEAEAMFEATVDPSFQDECLPQYYEQTDAYGGWCCDPSDHATPALFGNPVETDFAVVADDVQRRLQTDAFWIDEAGVSHGPERRESATMRIGRTIIVMDAVLEAESGDPVMSEDQFDTALADAALRARAQIVGFDG